MNGLIKERIKESVLVSDWGEKQKQKTPTLKRKGGCHFVLWRMVASWLGKHTVRPSS